MFEKMLARQDEGMREEVDTWRLRLQRRPSSLAQLTAAVHRQCSWLGIVGEQAVASLALSIASVSRLPFFTFFQSIGHPLQGKLHLTMICPFLPLIFFSFSWNSNFYRKTAIAVIGPSLQNCLAYVVKGGICENRDRIFHPARFGKNRNHLGLSFANLPCRPFLLTFIFTSRPELLLWR